jgi:glycosyltransferase involved in cell wall biosynthesis
VIESKEKRRILINGRFLLQPVTGVQRYAREIIQALSLLECQVFHFIIAVPTRGSFNTPWRMETIQDASVLPSYLWQQLRLPLIMKKTGAHLLWSPCNIGPLFVKNHVVTIHDASVFSDPSWFSRRFRLYYRLILPLLGHSSKRIVTVSEFSRKELIKYHLARQKDISVIRGGVSNIFRPIGQRPFPFPYILSVGTRDPRKNISRLIMAWKSLSPEIKENRKLVIVGMDMSAFSKEDLGPTPDDVELKGYISDKELPSYYSGADLFVFPSLYEGFGLPPLEAMACGCPVIVSNVASLPEVCGNAAYHVNPYSVENIAEGIQRILTDEGLRQSLIKKGLERAKLFSWENAAREHLEVFEKVLNS